MTHTRALAFGDDFEKIESARASGFLPAELIRRVGVIESIGRARLDSRINIMWGLCDRERARGFYILNSAKGGFVDREIQYCWEMSL